MESSVDLDNFENTNVYKSVVKICSDLDLKNDAAFNPTSSNKEKIMIDFPKLTRLAIVATYISSYNPPLIVNLPFMARIYKM